MGARLAQIDWIWPARGRIVERFTRASMGMDIGGRKGSPIRAAASGKVVYAGAGLRGYGKMVIIQHDAVWLSAYAHNEDLLVKARQRVHKGQKIARMGSSDTDEVKLHFEVHRQGEPIDPAHVLPAPTLR